MKFFTNNSLESEKIGEKIAANLTGNEIIEFHGDLGVGKTTLIRGIARYCHTSEDISSPTYNIMHEHDGEKFKIYHFDMYRIGSYEDLESTGFFDYIDAGVILIEWSENIEEFLPENTMKITIEKTNLENQRIITVEGANIE